MRVEKKVIIDRGNKTLTLEKFTSGDQRDSYEGVTLTIQSPGERGMPAQESIRVPLGELQQGLEAL